LFARRVRALVKQMPRNLRNLEDGRQLVRSSDQSVQTTSKPTSRSAESRAELEHDRNALIQEAEELLHIFNAIVRKRLA